MSILTQKRKLASILMVVMILTLFSGCGNSEDSSVENDSAGISSEDQKPLRSSADQEKLDQDIQDGYLILVNKQNYLPENYVPEDLESLKYYAKDRTADARFMKKVAADHFHEMVEAAQEEGIDIVSTTAYRSFAFQKNLYNHYVSTKGQEEADKVSARPGSSEHQTGLVADLSTSEINYVNGSAFGNSAAGKWIAEHCWEYGFIVRYPDGMEGITGYTYEPWHVRYVGETAAKEIFHEGITLEEYIEENHLGNSIQEVVEASKKENDIDADDVDDTDDDDDDDSTTDIIYG